MNSTEVLERRAERGTTRGAANVWGSVQLDMPRPTDNHTPWMSRAALLVWTVAVGVVGFFAITADDVTDTGPAQPDEAPVVSAEPLPEPILVEGMNLARVSRPFHTDFDGNDILQEPNVTYGEITSTGDQNPETTVVFADPDDPFNGPIVGLQLSNGGFRPWSANLSRSELDGLLDQLVRTGGEWTMPAESGLVEVANLSIGTLDLLEFGWQYDFTAGNSEVTLQAETSQNPDTISEWLWVARLVGEGDVGSVISEIEVLGQTGIQIQRRGVGDGDPIDGPVDEVVWASDGFAYRLTSSRSEGDRSISDEVTADISRLQIADRSAWVEAINAADRRPTSEGIVVVLAGLIFLGLAVSVAVFALKREFKTAAALTVLLAVILASGIGLLSSATPIWLLVLGALGLGLILRQPGRQAFG